MFSIEMLAAGEGDAIWIEYGHPNAPHRILIDGGPARTYSALRSRILALPPANRHLDVVVATHIDTDHIDGIVRLLRDESLGVTFGDIWFNGYPQLVLADTQGPKEGEFLGALIQKRKLPWNAAFAMKPVMVGKGFTPIPLADGMKATVVGPTQQELDTLLHNWKSVLEGEGWVPGDTQRALTELEDRSRLKDLPPIPALPDVLGGDDFAPDTSKANAASIAFILEDAEGHSCLLTGDSQSSVITPQLQALNGGSRVKVDVFKLPHHGSKHNVSKELLDAVDAGQYLLSSSGAKFGHPDSVTVERILERHANSQRRASLSFNYWSAFNEMWANPATQKARRYTAKYPEGITVQV